MKQITAADVLLTIGTATLILFLFISVYGDSGQASSVLIRVDEESWRYPLDTARTVLIPGPIGETEVHIEGGGVHVVDSP